MAFDINMIKEVYSKFPDRVEAARELLSKPLTLTEKILYGHLWDKVASEAYTRGKSYSVFIRNRFKEIKNLVTLI